MFLSVQEKRDLNGKRKRDEIEDNTERKERKSKQPNMSKDIAKSLTEGMVRQGKWTGVSL